MTMIVSPNGYWIDGFFYTHRKWLYELVVRTYGDDWYSFQKSVAEGDLPNMTSQVQKGWIG